MWALLQGRDIREACFLAAPGPRFRLSDLISVSLSRLQAESQTVKTCYLAGGALVPGRSQHRAGLCRTGLHSRWRSPLSASRNMLTDWLCWQDCALLRRQDVSKRTGRTTGSESSRVLRDLVSSWRQGKGAKGGALRRLSYWTEEKLDKF